MDDDVKDLFLFVCFGLMSVALFFGWLFVMTEVSVATSNGFNVIELSFDKASLEIYRGTAVILLGTSVAGYLFAWIFELTR